MNRPPIFRPLASSKSPHDKDALPTISQLMYASSKTSPALILDNGRMRVKAQRASSTTLTDFKHNYKSVPTMESFPNTPSEKAAVEEAATFDSKSRTCKIPVKSMQVNLPSAVSILWDKTPAGAKLLLLSQTFCPAEVIIQNAAYVSLLKAIMSKQDDQTDIKAFLLGRFIQRVPTAIREDFDFTKPAANRSLTLFLDRFDRGIAPASRNPLEDEPTLLLPDDIVCSVRISDNAKCPDQIKFKNGYSKLQNPIFLNVELDRRVGAMSMYLSLSLPAETVHAIPIFPLKISPGALSTDLFQQMLQKEEQKAVEYGWLVVDRTRACVLIHREDPKTRELPVSGFWISNVGSVRDVKVYSLALQFRRMHPELEEFLILVFGCQQRTPSFFSCTIASSDRTPAIFGDGLEGLSLDDHCMTEIGNAVVFNLHDMEIKRQEEVQKQDSGVVEAQKQDKECSDSITTPHDIKEPTTEATQTTNADSSATKNASVNPEVYLNLLQQQMELLKMQMGLNAKPSATTNGVQSSKFKSHVQQSIGTNTSLYEQKRTCDAATNTTLIDFNPPNTSKHDEFLQTSFCQLELNSNAKELTAKDLNLTTQIPSIMQPFAHQNLPPSTFSQSKYEPIYPQSLQGHPNDLWPMEQRLDGNEQRFTEAEVDWNSEGFTSLSERMQEQQQPEMFASPGVQNLLQRVSSALGIQDERSRLNLDRSSYSQRQDLLHARMGDDLRRHSFSTVHDLQKRNGANRKLVHTVEEVHHPEKSFILTEAVPADEEGHVQLQENRMPADNVQVNTSYDPARYKSEDKKLDTPLLDELNPDPMSHNETTINNTMHDLALLQRYHVNMNEITSLSSILPDESSMIINRSVTVPAKMHAPPLAQQLTNLSEPDEAKNRLNNLTVVRIKDIDFDCSVISDSSPNVTAATAEAFSIASLEYLRRHELL